MSRSRPNSGPQPWKGPQNEDFRGPPQMARVPSSQMKIPPRKKSSTRPLFVKMSKPALKIKVHSATPMQDELLPPEEIEYPAERKLSPDMLIREILQVVIPALLLALVIHLFLAQATVVYGRSMEPNLSESQRLIIDKLSYRLQTPQRNDIVVLNLPTMDEMLVKRIVGLPGETVAIQNGIVYINDIELEESFQHNLSDYDTQELTLGPLSYFVLGDNRTNSNDSRVFGSIKREHIVGRVWLRYWPMNQFRLF